MAVIALSRPEPGPLTLTSTSLTPYFVAVCAAVSAALCAANGVLLRLPLNPTVPDDAQQRASPLGSVIVTVVLLNVALMCTTARLTLRRVFLFLALATGAMLPGYRRWFECGTSSELYRENATRPPRRSPPPRREGGRLGRTGRFDRAIGPIRLSAFPSRPSCRRPSCGGPCGSGRLSGSAGRGPGAPCGAAGRDNSRCRGAGRCSAGPGDEAVPRRRTRCRAGSPAWRVRPRTAREHACRDRPWPARKAA